MKQNFGFKQIKAHPTNIRLRLKKKEEVNTDEALKVEKITTKVDYSSALRERAKKLEEEFGVDFSKLLYSDEVLSFIAEHGKLPISNEPLNCGRVKLYAGSCDTHSVVMYVRDAHNIDKILKNPPFCFIKNLEIEEKGTFDIKEAKDEWLDNNYNVVAYFEPYEPDVIGLDNKKGLLWQEYGNRFQVRLQTEEELLIRHYHINPYL